MAVAAAIDLFRSRWASRFVDTCTIESTTARGSFNTTTGVYVPYSETDIEPGDTLTVSTATYDAQLVGTYRVVDVEVDSWNTHRRLMCRRDMGEGHQP